MHTITTQDWLKNNNEITIEIKKDYKYVTLYTTTLNIPQQNLNQ